MISSRDNTGPLSGRISQRAFQKAEERYQVSWVAGRSCSAAFPRLLFVPLCLMLAFGPRAARAQEPNEYQVKAAFLYNFTKFVDWPEDPQDDNQKPFLVCVIGDDPFGASLDQFLADKSLLGHRLKVQRLGKAEWAKTCEIAFISSSEKPHLPSILDQLSSTNVLTVGDTPGFAEMGVMINFILQDDHVRFEINVGAAKRAGLRISSRLLSLAKIVRTQGGVREGLR